MRNRSQLSQCRQRGAILVVTLVIMVAMTLASVGLFRSVDTAMLLSGNLGFKRDVAMRINLAIRDVLEMTESASFRSDSPDYCITPACSKGSNTKNYSPVLLESNSDGIPLILLPAHLADYSTYMKGEWTTDAVLKKQTSDHGINIFYVIERACILEGQVTASTCVTDAAPESKAGKVGGDYRGSANSPKGPGEGTIGSASVVPQGPILFRVTVRAIGPRNAEGYVQAFIRPTSIF